MINDDQQENKLDDIRQISSLSTGYSSAGKQGNGPECLSKSFLSNMLSRDRRASISRPYFSRWRGARDSTRFIPKNLLAFSPRLGKREYEDDDLSNVFIDKRQINEEINSPDLDTFLLSLFGHLKGKKIDIVYEDSTKVCLSQTISNTLIQEVLDKFDTNRRQQEEQDKEEARERFSKSKHPLLFRYRLG
jgi:hypothetical protein